MKLLHVLKIKIFTNANNELHVQHTILTTTTKKKEKKRERLQWQSKSHAILQKKKKKERHKNAAATTPIPHSTNNTFLSLSASVACLVKSWQ